MHIKKKNLVTILSLLIASLTLSACNTSRGFGQDVERAGEEIQEEVD